MRRWCHARVLLLIEGSWLLGPADHIDIAGDLRLLLINEKLALRA